jgi:hypothetical protein
MMQRRGVAKRAWLALLLGVQLLGISIPLADARLDATASGTVHIEERTDRSCDPIHLHDDCVLCQHLAAQRSPAGSGSCSFALPAAVAVGTVPPEIRPSSTPAFLERGRSPPSV